MVKAGAIALLGLLAVSPVAHASDTPAFVHATMCDVAAPISSGATVFSRQIRTEQRIAKLGQAHPQAQRRVPAAARPAPRRPVEQVPAVTEAPVTDGEAVLYPAVHFCVTPDGASNPIRFT
jgi:hypothetical protein